MSEPIDRDAFRAKIFSAKKVKTKIVEFFGQEIELRQPTLGDVIDAQQAEDRQAAVINTLIRYAYIPGTQIRPFEEADAASFRAMPFGADFIRVSNALTELSEVNFLDTAKNSNETK